MFLGLRKLARHGRVCEFVLRKRGRFVGRGRSTLVEGEQREGRRQGTEDGRQKTGDRIRIPGAGGCGLCGGFDLDFDVDYLLYC